MSSLAPAGNPASQKQIGTAITCADDYFFALSEVVRRIPCEMVEEIAAALLQAYERGRRVFLFGNGGSAALASHFACDLGKGTAPKDGRRKRFRVMALTDNIPTMTAWANDASYDDIFAEQLLSQIEPGDIAFAISCSGNSPNVLRALQLARAEGAFLIGLAGFHGGKMKALCDLCLVVPSANMQIIEDLHLSVAHSIFSIACHRIQRGVTLTVAAAQSND
jgi:D-sedoheptulose 7-phosphate isomerase